jgi:rubredoxin
MSKYVCRICGYVYDEAVEKTPFAELPDDWKCPLCGAAKSDFELQNDTPAKEQKSTSTLTEPVEIKKLSAGQLSALCSNLARGCEKQYKTEEAGLFRELADYFSAITPAIHDYSVESISAQLLADIDYYSTVKNVGQENADRGALRVCVWGEKVTRMLSSLVKRYLTEGEKMLADTDIWVCTVCGFVYIGETPPELCPVCKVPAWKFEKIDGRISS